MVQNELAIMEDIPRETWSMYDDIPIDPTCIQMALEIHANPVIGDGSW